MEPHLYGLLPSQPQPVEYVILKPFLTRGARTFSHRAEGQRSRTTTTSEAGDAAPPPRPLCPPYSRPLQHARTAGTPAASLSPSGGSCRGRRGAHVHRPTVPGRLSPPVPHESLRP